MPNRGHLSGCLDAKSFDLDGRGMLKSLGLACFEIPKNPKHKCLISSQKLQDKLIADKCYSGQKKCAIKKMTSAPPERKEVRAFVQ